MDNKKNTYGDCETLINTYTSHEPLSKRKSMPKYSAPVHTLWTPTCRNPEKTTAKVAADLILSPSQIEEKITTLIQERTVAAGRMDWNTAATLQNQINQLRKLKTIGQGE